MSGDAIRSAREARKMTQEDLAKALGVTSATVSNWEGGRTSPRFRSAELVRFLQLDQDPPSDPRLSEATNLQLVQELLRRIDRGNGSPERTEG